MDNYIVRICRKEEDNPGCFAGVVEEVRVEEKKAFTSYDELWRILNSKKAGGKDNRERDKFWRRGNSDTDNM